MKPKVTFQKKFNNKEYRIATYNYFNYFDEIGGCIETDCPPEFRNAYVAIQIKKHFLFIPYWRTIKYYFSKHYRSIPLQEYNAVKWYYKNIENDGGL